MVSTSVLFSFFEAIQATTADAYRSHIYGAAKLLEVTKPKQCSHGVLCQIFYHLRTQLLLIHLTGYGQETPVEAKRILYETLDYVRLPVFQRLMGYISTLVEVYFAHQNGVTGQHADNTTYMNIKTDVESLWYEYVKEVARPDTLLVWKDASGTTHFHNAFTALTVAYFSAACILLSIIAPHVATPFMDSADHYTTILQASQHLHTHMNGCAYMRMAPPLLLVALHGLKLSQKRQATAYFACWVNKSMSGISALALESIYRHRASEGYNSISATNPSPQ
ncbi:Fungal transcriptional regulatory [Pyrenophora seminiperda CCB06]|uniref:Fungal transcriptional regulatory n=1 Tax=Pyrenophora seminiperda CCB06 TaxID=1302712 RepID=A0A3M7M4V5_9PLEO|nr:Fungal transcriptional regulatory [Pyrenophora seminiperda CCB06]